MVHPDTCTTIAGTMRLTLSLLVLAIVCLGQPQNPLGAKPYTDDDIAYGRTQQARIDKQRSAYASAKIEKDAAPPFHILGGLYWVGVHNWGCALIKTSEGYILIDTGWNETASLVASDIEQLGIKLSDIKILLMTDWHGDHNAAVAFFKEKTGAQLMVMDRDAAFVEKGTDNYPAAKVDRVLHDRDTVKLGDKVLTAYHVPGHTPGATTWYWQETEAGVTYMPMSAVGSLLTTFHRPRKSDGALAEKLGTAEVSACRCSLSRHPHLPFRYLGKI